MVEKFRVLTAGPNRSATREFHASLEKDGDLELTALVHSESEILEGVRSLEPDILLVDLGMSDADEALSTVKSAKAILPDLAVIVVSSVLETNITMKALAAGALEYVAKDSEKLHSTTPKEQLDSALRSAKTFVSKARGAERSRSTRTQRSHNEADSKPSVSIPKQLEGDFDLILIGISTGGPSALETIFSKLGDRDLPPILIVQHMGRLFTNQLAATLARKSGRTVQEAWRQSELKPNSIYVAPGGFHTEVRVRTPGEEHHRLRVVEDPPVNGFCPSVDVTWQSVARHFKGKVAAFIMTGMGDDGAVGLQHVRESGAVCVAQDEASSVVWGMPGAAVRAGTPHHVLSLDEIRAAFHKGLGRSK